MSFDENSYYGSGELITNNQITGANPIKEILSQ